MQSDQLKMITCTNDPDVRLPSFFAIWLESKSGQSLQVVCLDPGLQILFLRHHKVADIGLLDWVMFSGVLIPVYPCKYSTDSSATARPPVFVWLRGAKAHRRRGNRHHQLNYCAEALCRTMATSATTSQISQTS